MAVERVLDLVGVHNFRDHGGYAVAGGGRLKRGLLWRSGQHFGASDGDLDRIGELGLDSVFDLRSSKERMAHPCRRPEHFAARIHIPEDPQRQQLAPHVAAAGMFRQSDAASTREALRRNYHGIAFRPELIAITRTYLAELARGTGPSLINCMAGKDRTGIAVAMLHLAVGVHRDDVIADYLLTNTAGDSEARIQAGIASIRAHSPDISDEVVRVVMGVEAEYLEAAFDKIAENHGSLDAYLCDVLGVDHALREGLRDALVEG